MDAFCWRVLNASKSSNGLYMRSQCMRRSMCTTPRLAAKSTRSVKQPAKKPRAQPLEHKTQAYKPSTSIPKSTSTPLPPPRPNPLKNRSIPIVLGSITAIAFSGYTTYLYIQFTRPLPHPVPTTPVEQADVSKTYDAIAPTFDAEVSLVEQTMGINKLRRKLASMAHGDVLEVSIGTGRNLDFYDFDFARDNVVVGRGGERAIRRKGTVRSFTAVDKSPEMLEIAHEKFGELFPGILGVRWVIGDAAEKGIIPPPPRSANERSGGLEGKKYDTILQTMGLCSVSDPVALLRNLGEHVVEESGRILLLEHGRGTWKWMNGALDRGAEGHAKKFGCWWNRDFTSVIEESGLEVVKIERPIWHGGTTWWIELKKPKSSSSQKVEVTGSETPAATTSKKWLWA